MSARPPLARGALRVLFIAPDEDAPTRYRCVNAAEQLARDGVWAAVRRADDPALAEVAAFASLVVLFRLPWTDRIARVVDAARGRGVKILFDTDDLVFDPDRMHSLTFLDRLPPEDRRHYEDLVPRIRQTFDAADHVLAATTTLADHARLLGKPADVHPNLASPRDERRAAVLRALRPLHGRGPVLGYASGSHTHDEDLDFVAPILARVLERSDARLVLGGFVNLPSELGRFPDRLIRLPYLDPTVYPWALARCRAVLSPAAETNAFTNAKSPMKLLEAGLLDVPTLATPTDAYRQLITSGWNGWLAQTEDEWLECLEEALDEGRARAVGRRARETVQQRLSYAAHAGRLRHLLERIAGSEALAAVDGASAPSAARVAALPQRRRSPRHALRRWRQRILLLRRGDVGRETVSVDAVDWWRPDRTKLIEPAAFEQFLERSDGRWCVDGWKPAGGMHALRSESWQCTNNDPQLLRVDLDLEASGRRFLVVRQRTRTPTGEPSAQLFFAVDGAPFSEEASVRFPVAPNGKWRTYVLDLAATSWPREGRITALRYDPVDAPGTVDLPYVALLPPEPELLAPASVALRAVLATRYLHGRGAEFGALQNPLALPPHARAFYVDQLTYAAARRCYPELDGQPIVRPAIVSDAERLALRPASLDFAIANHLLEHAKDPIAALEDLIRVVRPGGVVFASVPDVGNPLDRGRPVTPIEHLLADHERRAERSAEDLAHYREAITSAHPERSGAALEDLIRERTEIAEAVHFHTFDETSFRWLLGRVDDVDVEQFVRNRVGDWDEYIAILRRRRQLERAGN